MDKNNDLMNFAMIMVDSTAEKYLDGSNKMAFPCMLMGIGKCRLESFPGAGHNYYVMLEAIYRYYREHPDKNVDKILFNSLMKCIDGMSAIEVLSLICNYIVAQIKNEKQGISPFKLDNIQLLKQLKIAVLNDVELNNELSTTLLDNTTRICEETMGKKVL